LFYAIVVIFSDGWQLSVYSGLRHYQLLAHQFNLETTTSSDWAARLHISWNTSANRNRKFTLLDTEKHEVLLPVRVLQLDADGMRTEKLFQLFHKLFSRHGRYVLVVALGGNTGTNLFSALTAWLQSQKQNWDAIASLPFAFEGHHSRQMAENAIAEANKQQNIHIFELESIRLQYGHLLMEKAMEKADGRFYEVYGRMGQS